MIASRTEPTTLGLLGLDPGRAIRLWVAFLLRVGTGLALLSVGLAGYFGARGRGPGAGPWWPGPSSGMLDPFLSGMPYLAMGLGLALILGFLTTTSAIGATLYGLLTPIFGIVQVIAAGSLNGFNMGNQFGNDQYLIMMTSIHLPNLLTNVATIWLSPLENHPYSIDALIFGRNELETESFPTPNRGPEPAPDPGPPVAVGE